MGLAAADISPGDITVFLLAVGVLIGAAKLFGEVARHFRQPAVLGEIIAGVLLGPTVLGALLPGVQGWLFPTAGPTAIGLEMLITLAAILLLLVAGLEVNLSLVWSQGRATILVSIFGLVVPFGLGLLAAAAMPEVFGRAPGQSRLHLALFVGIALSITALPVIAKILMDLNIAKSALGILILSAAMLNDLVGWIGFALVLALMHAGAAVGPGLEQAAGEAAAAGHSQMSLPLTIGLTLLFLALVLTLGRALVHRALPFVQAHASWPGGVLVFVIVIALLCAALTEWIGIHSIFGGFIAGVAIGDSAHLRERTRETIHQFITNIFGSLFFASIGLQINFLGAFDVVLVMLLMVLAVAGKVGGCWIGARLARMSHRESAAVGCGMVARGAIEIILGQRAFEAGLIGEKLFVAIVVMALLTSLISGPAMKKLLRLEGRRRLVDVLAERNVVLRLRGRSRNDAIGELAERAAAIARRPAREIYGAVSGQERAMSSGLEHGLAVPHARLEGLTKPVIVIGLSDAGIDFDAVDGEPARIICMLLSSADDHAGQVQLLDMVARAFAGEETRAAVLAAASYTELRAALSVGSAEEATPPQKGKPPRKKKSGGAGP